MFKILKILNSGTNVPEPEIFPCDVTIAAPAGSALSLNSDTGHLAIGEPYETPFCVLAEDHKSGTARAMCYRITPDMILEAPVFGDPLKLYNGAGIILHSDPKHGLCGVSDSEDTRIATVYSTNGAKKYGDKILIYFK